MTIMSEVVRPSSEADSRFNEFKEWEYQDSSIYKRLKALRGAGRFTDLGFMFDLQVFSCVDYV